MKKKKYNFKYCMKNRCEGCKRSRECENQEKKKGDDNWQRKTNMD